MRVLVTGAAGFIGYHTAARLLDRGDEVIGFAPALIVPDEEAPLGEAAAAGRMEIVTVTGQRIMVGADVDALALARVVAALEAR